ncbi:hypothetical protein RRG08_031762 [Elysia crispata]|uniref:Leucine--tRNA ligase ubiquitin-like domain-containing protein n=1 Tax=Elysia crispata TaxID=231223 RepID=A0AAE1AX98_9GAST|nr:hypothetical protein RRG08_031762 [Elysia crispata]
MFARVWAWALGDVAVKKADSADDKVKEGCCPGKPFITFYTEPSVVMNLTNPQPSRGLLEITIPIYEGDTSVKIAARMTRAESSRVKDASSVTLLRYEDPESGWRKIPDMTKIMDGKVEIEPDQTFHVDTATGKVSISVQGSKMDVGTRMLYLLSD